MKANSSQTNVHNPRQRHICRSIAGAQPYSHNPGSQRHLYYPQGTYSMERELRPVLSSGTSRPLRISRPQNLAFSR
jgi:hypothetical protein